ncbi:unnamed protein product [Hermetia illucens]|uniref:Uncharacterized protein n=1 Tax=Hermetia illucens TaxID=343691 RepID=A0A7R8UBX2_HERIL|nr:uncharacterized protein LOC119658424 [Hermetia illucens]XP_037922942.1 uncharacterized protein LOC119658424 [Hermetia illucens]XP_037923737.1 uncharacterized protein LOC119658424 [Hermetia illucens]CAD7077877.1 unnamed protein product [Hermetia illucens]
MTKASRKGASVQQKGPVKPLLSPQQEEEVKAIHAEDDDSYNSGFGAYLRSAEGSEMMKLFVMANSILVILTMAWPSMREFAEWLKEFLNYYL